MTAVAWLLPPIINNNTIAVRYYTTNNPPPPPTSESAAVKLKRAVKDYGATVIVFHVTISIASLSICYAAVARCACVALFLSPFFKLSYLKNNCIFIK